VSADLDDAVYALLTPARGVIGQHTRNDRHQCRRCNEPWPCFEADTAIGALELALRVHAAARRQTDLATGSPSAALDSVRESVYRRMAPAVD
jgi:hypothetical protein